MKYCAQRGSASGRWKPKTGFCCDGSAFEAPQRLKNGIFRRSGRIPGASDQDLDVLDRRDQPVLQLLTREATPAGAFEVVTAAIGEASFPDMSSSSSVLSPFQTRGLLPTKVDQFLIGVAVDRSAGL